MNAEQWLLEQFLRWEARGRGWLVWPERVVLEPPFRRFEGHTLPRIPDDGRRSTLLGRFARRAFGSGEEPPKLDEPEESEPEAEGRDETSDLVELLVTLPPAADVSSSWLEQCLFSLPPGAEPLAFELLGTAEGIVTQFVCDRGAANLVQRQLIDHLPAVTIVPRIDGLAAAFPRDESSLVAELGLHRPFMVPLATLPKGLDPYVGLVAALAQLREHEAGVVQVLFERVHNPWSESIWRAVTDNSGGPFFSGAPEMLTQTKAKVARPLFSVVLRIGVRAGSFDRRVELGRSLTAAFGVFRQPGANHLIPLDGADYSDDQHEADLLERQTRRSGMLLNSDELLALVHLPTSSVVNSKLQRDVVRTKAVPSGAQGGPLLLGTNQHAGVTTEVRLTHEQRTQHIHVIGSPGTGKSTLLLNMMLQDAQQGEGFALLDPHGDLVDQLLGQIPESRWGDVILLDAADEEYPFGLNLLDAHSELEKTLLASDLVAVFQRLSTSWGDQMTSILGNAILAFLESSRGGTLPEVRRFLVDAAFRKQFLPTVTDPEVVYYWEHEFALLRGGSIAPLMTRLDAFLRPKLVRYMVGQRENRLDVTSIMDSGKILLARLPQGLIGESNAYLLGALLVGKFQQMAIARQARDASKRRPFLLYVDEFHELVTPSMATILSGARKYQLGLVLAHQNLRQLQRNEEVASSVLSNPYVRICFHVGDQDARWLAEGFGTFEAKDLQQLGRGEAICRVERATNDFNLRTAPPPSVAAGTQGAALKTIRELSRQRFARSRSEVERDLAHLRVTPDSKADPFSKRAAKQSADDQSPNTVPPEPKPPTPPEPPKPAATPAPPKPATTPKTAPPREKAESIKNRIIQTAGGFGFSYETEKPVPDGSHPIDLVLSRGELVIAIEISATTSAGHELEMIQKCLPAGYERIVHLCDVESRRRRIEELVEGTMSPADRRRIRCLSTSAFLEHLAELATGAIDKASASAGPKDKSPVNLPGSSSPQDTAKEARRMLEELARRLGRTPPAG